MKLLQLFFTCLGLALLPACQQQTATEDTESTVSGAASVLLQNPADFEQTDALVVLTRQQIEKVAGEISAGMVPVVMDSTGNYLPSQADDLNNNGQWDEMAFLASLPAGASVSLALQLVPASEVPGFTKRTAVHFGRRDAEDDTLRSVERAVLIRKLPTYNRNQVDGPAWENDHIGFRMYFDGRNAFDVFGKRTSEMVLHTVGYDENKQPVDNYHEMEDWGRDVLSVGNSLGAGGLAMLENDQLYRLGIALGTPEDVTDTTAFELTTTGPVRSLFTLTYMGWEVAGNRYEVKEIIGIPAGKHYYTNTVAVTGFSGIKTLVTGMSTRFNDQPARVINPASGFTALMTHDQQSYNKEFYMGMALMLPDPHFAGEATAPETGQGVTETFYAKVPIQNNEPVTWYFFAATELEDPAYQQAENFEQLLRREARQIATPPEVSLQKMQ